MTFERSVLSPADDYLIHQTADMIRHVSTSDRRFYDRHFWTGHSNDGAAAFLAGMGCYPNLGVIDAFCTISLENRQITVRGSRELTNDRMDTNGVGPFGLSMLEGLKSHRFVCAEVDGVAFDLIWTNSGAALEEPPFFKRVGGRVVQQGQRFVQSGRWEGFIAVDGKRFEVAPETWWGSRDHSWGVRSIGLEDEPPGILATIDNDAEKPGMWVWAPIQFPGSTLHFNIGDNRSGERILTTVRRTDWNDGGRVELMRDAGQDLSYDGRDHTLRGGSLWFADSRGNRRTIGVTPLRSIYLMAATGYAVPGTSLGANDDWRHGKYMGPNWSSVKRFDLSQADVRATVGIETGFHVSRLELDDGEVGYAAVELLIT